MQKPFRLFITVPGSFETGGVGRQVQYLTEWLKSSKKPVEITFLDTRGTASVVYSPWYLCKSIGKLAASTGERRSSAVHINLASYASTARKSMLTAFASLFGFPILLHLHGAEYRQFYQRQPGFIQAVIRWMFARADRVVVLGAVWKEFVHTVLQVPEDKIHVIANAVPAPLEEHAGDDDDEDDQQQPIDDVPVLLFLGRLGERKGVADLLKALAQLKELPYRAVLAGDGDRATFLNQAESLGIADKVQFPGWVDTTTARHYLLQASVFVLPSYNEGLPMAVLESLSYAVPVVSTPVGSIPEAIEDGKNGYLVPPGDVDTLAARLRTLLTDNALRQKMQAAAHDRYEKHYRLDICGERFWQVYQQMLAPGKADG